MTIQQDVCENVHLVLPNRQNFYVRKNFELRLSEPAVSGSMPAVSGSNARPSHELDTLSCKKIAKVSRYLAGAFPTRNESFGCVS